MGDALALSGPLAPALAATLALGPPLDLCTACALDDAPAARELLEAGADLALRNREGWTPLLYLSFLGHAALAEALLATAGNGCGPALEAADPERARGPLLWAAALGHEALLAVLLAAGASPLGGGGRERGEGTGAPCDSLARGGRCPQTTAWGSARRRGARRAAARGGAQPRGPGGSIDLGTPTRESLRV